ncbi:MAG: GNAT family protein [Candidatus Thermoplasmatota archaeon]|nr:GNAT family protein [Candidatus Thermoplasmatota archaeon]
MSELFPPRPVFLKGERLYLAPIEADDAPMAQFWFNDPEIRSNLASQFPLPLKSEEDFLSGMNDSASDIIMLIVLSDTNQPIGTVGLHKINPVHGGAEIGISIGEKNAWGKGHGAEAMKLALQYAFNTLALHRVELTVIADNLRARRLYEKLGFKEEGAMREKLFIEGRRKDTVVMSLLAHEWHQYFGDPGKEKPI